MSTDVDNVINVRSVVPEDDYSILSGVHYCIESVMDKVEIKSYFFIEIHLTMNINIINPHYYVASGGRIILNPNSPRSPH